MMTGKDKISNPLQVGGIELARLDDGAGRDVRIAWINAGSGLRYKVVLDRGMDIADAFFNQFGLAWISHAGVKAPPASYQRGLDWLRHWGGGLLTTCGLDHMGSPEIDALGDRGLHGQIGYMPAEVRMVDQPDPVRDKMDFSIQGIMKQSRVFGARLELERTISGVLGQAEIRIRDKVTNRGNTPEPHMMLYHINLGWPLVDEGAEIFWQGEWCSRGEDQDNAIFHNGGSFQSCPAPLDQHRGSGEACVFIDVKEDQNGCCECGIDNQNSGIRLTVRFRKEQLPWLINWQHWGKGEYVTGLEPATNPPTGQAPAREKGSLLFLNPGESKEYEIYILVEAKQ